MVTFQPRASRRVALVGRLVGTAAAVGVLGADAHLWWKKAELDGFSEASSCALQRFFWYSIIMQGRKYREEVKR